MSWLRRAFARLNSLSWRTWAITIFWFVFRIVIAAVFTSLWGDELREFFAILAALGGVSFVSAVYAAFQLFVQMIGARTLWRHTSEAFADCVAALKKLIDAFRNRRE
jgi:hypothetical protein